jgi:hypothetical protein
MNEQYYTDVDICNLMEISLSRLRARICEGKPLPPRIEIPDSRTRLWDKQTVHSWLDKYTVSSDIEKASIRRVIRK